MRALEGGAQLVDAQVALGQPSRAREDELGQERAAVRLDDDAVGRVFHLDVIAGHRCLFCCSSFFLRFRSVFSTWPKGCLRAGRSREWLSGSPLVLGDFCIRSARICYRLHLKTQLFWDCCEQPLRAAIPSGPELV